jgi:hypothetical protein
MADALISNGTCYHAKGQQMDKKMIPCGNSAFGHIQCCQAGDYCLSHLACFNTPFGVTYLAGCTDEGFGDSSCPDKKQWKGEAVHCESTTPTY